MKGVVIFDERADLAFYSLDKEMEDYILGRMQELEAAAGARVSSNTTIIVTILIVTLVKKLLDSPEMK